ncbi:MAG: hypothetical protein ACRC92_05350 [Peptostreptococcaceae bacterium]
MESNKLYENINNKTLPDKLTIVDEFKSKIIDYIESDLIFQDEKTLEEDLEQIGLTFIEYKKYSQDLSKIIQISKIEKINNLNDYIKFINAIKEIPSFLEGIDIVEETIDKHTIKNVEQILQLDVKIQNQNEYLSLLSSIYNCKDYLKENYEKVASYVINKYIKLNTVSKEVVVDNAQTKNNVNTIDKAQEKTSNKPSIIDDFLAKAKVEVKKEEPQKEVVKKEEPKKLEPKVEKKANSIVDIFKELIEEELKEKENNEALINDLYEKYTLMKSTLIECEIIKIDNSYLYLKQIDNNEENLMIKMRKIPLHNYRVGGKEKGYIAETKKIEDTVEVLIVKSLQSIAAIEEKETKKTTTKTRASKSTKSAKVEDTGGYSEKYFKDLFNKMKSELGITMCNVKKCAYDSHYGALIIIDNKKKNSSEEIKFVESLMNKKCGEDIIKIIEFKYDAIEFLSHVFEVDKCDVIKGTGKYIVVNYDTNMMPWFKFMSEQINSMVNYKIEF